MALVCKAYHCPAGNSRADLTQLNVQHAKLYLISISGTNLRRVCVAMRVDSLNAVSTGNILRRPVLGSQPAMQRAVCKVDGPKV